jgi:hypothetical protein
VFPINFCCELAASVVAASVVAAPIFP